MRKKKKTKFKTISVLLVALIFPALLCKIFYNTPFLAVAAEKAAVFSTGIMFFEGGYDLLTYKAEQNEAGIFPTLEKIKTPDKKANTNSSSSKTEPVITNTTETNDGPILDYKYTKSQGASYLAVGPACLKNTTKLGIAEIDQIIKQKLAIKVVADKSPQVLIVSTHATESFEITDKATYSNSFTGRSTDNEKSILRVAKEIKTQLENENIGTIVDTTLHDYPSYNGAYKRSAQTIKDYLKKYPNIEIVIDLHRDFIQREDGARIKPVATIGGKKAAQVMIIAGCDDGTMGFPTWKNNLQMSGLLLQKMETLYPGLTRPMVFGYYRYNLNLTKASMLIEVGTSSNSLDQAIYTGELIGKSLAKTIKEI